MCRGFVVWWPMQNIVVIGGGVAGLAAAVELARAGRRVTLLEARKRLGGRILTRHAGRTPIELGAEFIHGGNREFWEQIQAARLKTVRVPNRFRVFENGAFQKTDPGQAIRTVVNQTGSAAPDESFARFLARHEFPGLTKRLATHFVEGFEAAHPDKIGMRGLLASNEDETGPGARQFRIQRGYSALVKYLEQEARRLGANLWTGAVVESIHWKKRAVRVFVSRNQKPVVHDFHTAVVTLPLGVLKAGNVKFVPPLPRDKVRVIDGLEFGNAVKVGLKFRRVFWPQRDFGFVVAVGEPVPTWWSDSRGPILTGWAGGPKADLLSGKTPAQLKSEAVRLLAKILKTDAALIRRELLALYFHSWSRDEFSAGAYSYIPVNGLDLPGKLASPVKGTLFFAGEATAGGDEWGTVHAALSSGLRAAREVCAD
ncbi:MAG TPA: NAD(P)/FAD-dependent oxidoreductase [Verrucomicrobiae bacterium]|nr:NAD(P)/FAD-dependent oxidoreductase [Verrucomicrobiae bacterium]